MRKGILAVLTLLGVVSAVSSLYNETCTSITEEPVHLLRVERRAIKGNKAKCVDSCARVDGCLFYRRSGKNCWIYKINDDAEYLQCGSPLADENCLVRAPIRVPMRLANHDFVKNAKSAQECAEYIKASSSVEKKLDRFFEYIGHSARHPPGVCRIFRRRGEEDTLIREYTKNAPNAYLCPKVGGIRKLGENCASSYDCEEQLYCSDDQSCQSRVERRGTFKCFLGRACADGFNCQFFDTSGHGKCTAEAQYGAACVRNDECPRSDQICGLDAARRRVCQTKLKDYEEYPCLHDEECYEYDSGTSGSLHCVEEKLSCAYID